MTSPGLLPEGFHDRLPPHSDAQAALVRAILDTAFGYGYERVTPPLAEFEDGLAGRLKAGSAHDAVRFVDPVSQRTLAIRPDITAQVGRIAATRMAHHPRPLRLCYGGSVLKLRASQLRPEREMVQTGCELVGLDSVAAAAEIVAVAVEALEAAGVRGLTLDFTLPDLLDMLAAGPLPLGSGAIDTLRNLLDGKDAGGVATAGAAGYLPLIAAAGPFDEAMRRLRAFDTSGVLGSRLDGLEAIAETLRGRVVLTLDPTERHGFEYKSWLGFSLFADGVRGEIGRGGSYVILHADGAEEPALGFSIYCDALVDAGLSKRERRRLFVPLGADATAAAQLRAEGWVTVAGLTPDDTPQAQICTHVLKDGTPQPVRPD